MSEEQLRHLIIKYGNQLAQGHDTIEEHRSVLRDQGAVWFGKIGASIGKNTIASISKQIDAGKPAYLFLFQSSERINIHRGRIVAIQVTRPTKAKMIPAYYAECEIDRLMKLWIKLSSLVRVKTNVLDEYHTVSSGKKALHSASKSMAGLFVIAEGASTLDAF